ncbi:hypothetical protein ACFYYR_28430 [Streptomyces sp. NPDC001922]|uniref:hypothetical protein n=1 Tax=Streptomyces sp. NPDC001922 TaxID=3364624 RepID=UPI0036C3A2D2
MRGLAGERGDAPASRSALGDEGQSPFACLAVTEVPALACCFERGYLPLCGEDVVAGRLHVEDRRLQQWREYLLGDARGGVLSLDPPHPGDGVGAAAIPGQLPVRRASRHARVTPADKRMMLRQCGG